MHESTESQLDQPLRWERQGDVAVITLDRPQRLNALTVSLIDDLVSVIGVLDHDQSIGAAVLTGAGRAFSAGGDMVDIAGRSSGDGELPALMLLRDLQRAILALRASRLPIVGAVNGPVYGAGWSVALACDMLVAAADARFCQVFSRRSLVPDLGSAWLLQRVVGAFRAKELIFLGEEITAADALAVGLVNRVAEDASGALSVAVELAGRAAAGGPAVAAMTKSLVNGAQSMSLEDALRVEEHAQAIALRAPATQEAIAAFISKQAR